MTQIIHTFCHDMLENFLLLIVTLSEGGHLMRHFDEKTLAAEIHPAFVKKETKLFGNFFSKWRAEK